MISTYQFSVSSFVNLMSALVCLSAAMSAAGQGAAPASPPWSRVAGLPLRFMDGELQPGPQPRLTQRPAWQPELFKSDPALAEEVHRMVGIFLHGLNNQVVFQCRASPGQPWTTPLQLVTSPAEADAAGMMSRVGTTSLTVPRDGPLPQGLGRHFDLVDLWGCESGPAVHAFVSALDSTGTLVLPFAGVDFQAIRRLPPRLRKLVVYNSLVDARFDRLVKDVEGLEEVVLWGCRSGEDVFVPRTDPKAPPRPEYNHHLFENLAARLASLTLISCSRDLADCLGWHSWPHLKTLETTGTFFQPYAWGLMAKHPANPTRIPKPEYPALEKLIFYERSSKQENLSEKAENTRQQVWKALAPWKGQIEVRYLPQQD